MFLDHVVSAVKGATKGLRNAVRTTQLSHAVGESRLSLIMSTCHSTHLSSWYCHAIIFVVSVVSPMCDGAAIFDRMTFGGHPLNVYATKSVVFIQLTPFPHKFLVKVTTPKRKGFRSIAPHQVIRLPYPLRSSFLHAHPLSDHHRKKFVSGCSTEYTCRRGGWLSERAPFARSTELSRPCSKSKQDEFKRQQLSGNDLRLLLESVSSIISFDVGSSKTGAACARRQFPSLAEAGLFGDLVSPVGRTTKIGLKNYGKLFAYGIRNDFKISALPLLLHGEGGFSQLLQLSQVAIEKHLSTEMPFRPSSPECTQEQTQTLTSQRWKGLVLVGIALNPHLSAESKYACIVVC